MENKGRKLFLLFFVLIEHMQKKQIKTINILKKKTKTKWTILETPVKQINEQTKNKILEHFRTFRFFWILFLLSKKQRNEKSLETFGFLWNILEKYHLVLF